MMMATDDTEDNSMGFGDQNNELTETQKLQLAERANEIYRQQLKYMQDHLASLRSLIQDKENIIENLMLRYDLGIITQDQNRTGDNLSPDEIEMEELRRKAEALAQRTILENFELREMVNELRDENFHLRNEIYELQDKINRQVLQINKLEKNTERGVQNVIKQRIRHKRNKYIQIWLKNRNLLRELDGIKDEKFLRICRDKIFDLFGFKDIINSFIDLADINKLEILFKQMKVLKMNYDENNKDNQANDKDDSGYSDGDTDDDDDCDMVQDVIKPKKKRKKTSFFDKIPPELWSYIFGFCAKYEFWNIKLYCNRMAVIALKEMDKYSVGIFNCNELLYHQNDGIDGNALFGDNHNKKLKSKLIKYHRYNANMNYNGIFEHYVSKYDIPLQYQLLYKVNNNTKLPLQFVDIKQLSLNQSLTNKATDCRESDGSDDSNDGPYRFKSYQCPEYMLFDKRNVIVLKPQCKPRKLMSSINKKDDDIEQVTKKYKIVFLKYFDVEQQRIKIVSILMVHPKIDVNDLYSFIKGGFINVNDNDNWYNKFSDYLGEMGGWNDEKLIFLDTLNRPIVESDDEQDSEQDSEQDYEDDEEDDEDDDEQDDEDDDLLISKPKKRNKGKKRKSRSEKKTSLINIEQGSVFLFQLNSMHPWFKSTNQFDKTKNKHWFNDVKMFIKHYTLLKKQKLIKASTKRKKPKLSNTYSL